MAQLTPETIRRLARDNFDYELSEETADTMSRAFGPLLAMTGDLQKLGLDGVEPPFGYANLVREAQRLADTGK